jgi:acyl-CoA synthetase (NDP forming)
MDRVLRAGALLAPRSIAVVGATKKAGFGATTLANLRSSAFPGPIAPVNPRYDELDGLRCYPALDAVPGEVDLALIAVPAAAAPGALRDCAAKGVAAAVVFASGFAETGDAGRALQDELTAIARDAGMAVLGPNCMGFVHQPAGLVASFTGALREGLLPGSGAAYVGQSGAIGGAVLGMAAERGFGFDSWFSTGNEADLGSAEIVEALVEEPAVRVIGTYLEAIPRGDRWQRACARAAELGKRIVVLRSGRSVEGRRAAASHTGAMIRSDAAFTLVNRAAGVIEVSGVDELVGTVEALVTGRVPAGPRIGVVTSSGGAGGILVDQLDAAGLALAELAPGTRAALDAVIPAFGSSANPVDVTAQLFVGGDDAFVDACRPILDDPGVDALSIVLTTIIGPRAAALAGALTGLAAATTKPIGVVWLAGTGTTWEGRGLLRRAGIPVTSSVAEHVTLLKHQLVRPSLPDETEWSPPLRPATVDELFAGGPAVLTEHKAARLLDEAGVPRPESVLARTAEEAVAAAARLGGPVVLKVQSPQITHKTEVGGVRLGVAPDGVAAAFGEVAAAVPGAPVDGVLVQRMAGPGVELVVGISGAADGYPPVVTVGMGGVSTEVYADVVSALAPLTPQAVGELLGTLRGHRLLDGFRGRPPVAVAAAAEAVAALSRAAVQLGGRLGELEINPLVVDGRGAVALDLLVRTTGRGTET